MKVQIATKSIKKEDRLCMKYTLPEALWAKGAFQIQPTICGVNFSNNILIPYIAWHNLWNLLTINLKDKSFHYFIEWTTFKLGFNHGCEKFSNLQCSDYWKIYFLELPPTWNDLIFSFPIYNNPSINLPQKHCPLMESSFCKKVPLAIL